MLAKIKTLLGDDVVLTDAGKWVSDNTSVSDMLNACVDSQFGLSYAPNVAKRRAEIAAKLTLGKVVWYEGKGSSVKSVPNGVVQ